MKQPAGPEPQLTRWLCDAGLLTAPLTFERLKGGNSNVTVRVDDAVGRSVVLRRPPDAAQPGTYNLAREHEILAGLARTDVPAPAALAYCSDRSVWGADFSVAEYVVGWHIADVNSVRSVPAEVRARIGEAVVRTLAVINRASAREMGVEYLVRGGYLRRQIARWASQVAAADSPRLRQFEAVRARLEEHLPNRAATTLLHGDYRVDNCLLSTSGDVAAVVDWELAAFGDPLVDLALLYAYWDYPGSPNDEGIGLPPAPTAEPGFPTKEQIIATYARYSGYNVDDLAPYIGFAYWKIACIGEGVLWRYRHRDDRPARDHVVAAVESQIDADLTQAGLALGPAAGTSRAHQQL